MRDDHGGELGYPVVVAAGAIESVGAIAVRAGATRAVVLCDANVEQHARRVAASLPAGTPMRSFALGEERKNLATLAEVYEALAALEADRTTLVVGVGGGVAGDLFGFAAATYMRGVPFLNVATSLVAMVDAAVGGKTAVDLPAGKNLAGAFADPIAVVADVETLATLPEAQMREGLGEMIKHAMLDGEAAFAELERWAAEPFERWPWARLVGANVAVKAAVVAGDRTERGDRERLNLGHTFAHAFERAAEYRISHGNAVAVGLRAAGLAARQWGPWREGDQRRLVSLLERLGLPTSLPGLGVDEILSAMRMDKKRRAGRLRFVLPRALGDVVCGVELDDAVVREAVERCTR
ncbi:MAG TPA: 3-dehydroquinate synthase [Candidatus Dormibacteraeota bacterium]|nr:3-dehydroquinate synthase [Candidatus Dormibacteraeota bacterium]